MGEKSDYNLFKSSELIAVRCTYAYTYTEPRKICDSFWDSLIFLLLCLFIDRGHSGFCIFEHIKWYQILSCAVAIEG